MVADDGAAESAGEGQGQGQGSLGGADAQVALLGELMEKRAADGGLFITFEGGDGSGKTTITRLLAADLEGAGFPVLLTREPGGTELGIEVRRLVMHGPDDVDPRTEALLYAADRAYHVATMVRPALGENRVVLGDRYIDSSVAYQGAARQLGTEEVRRLSEWATGGLQPDLTLFFDVDADVGLARTGDAPDRLERSGAQFHRAVRDQYLQMLDQFPQRIVLVDASGTIEETYRRVVDALVAHLSQGGVAP